MDFKFGLYIHRVHPKKNPLKRLEKMQRGRMQGLPKVVNFPYYLTCAYLEGGRPPNAQEIFAPFKYR